MPRKTKHSGIASVRCGCEAGHPMERVGGSSFTLSFHCEDCGQNVEVVCAVRRPDLGPTDLHKWAVNITEHPFLTGWKCARCGTTCMTTDGTGEKPKSSEPCVPKVTPPV